MSDYVSRDGELIAKSGKIVSIQNGFQTAR
jgi:hypothetical protein